MRREVSPVQSLPPPPPVEHLLCGCHAFFEFILTLQHTVNSEIVAGFAGMPGFIFLNVTLASGVSMKSRQNTSGSDARRISTVFMSCAAALLLHNAVG